MYLHYDVIFKVSTRIFRFQKALMAVEWMFYLRHMVRKSRNNKVWLWLSWEQNRQTYTYMYISFLSNSHFPLGSSSTINCVCVYVITLDSWHYLNILNTKFGGSAAAFVEYVNGPLRKLSSGRATLRTLWRALIKWSLLYILF